MTMLGTLLAFAVAIGVLVTFHEFGHYWVARRCGVKVLRFSIGFGKPLYTVRWRGTDWTLSPIPLGGYVKMLDEREAPVAVHELHRAFNRQSVWRRIAVVAAGPLANFVLAFVFFWLLASMAFNGAGTGSPLRKCSRSWRTNRMRSFCSCFS